MTSEPLAPGAPAIILYRQVDRVDGWHGYEDNYVRIKILTEDGRKYGDAEIPFFKDGEYISNLRARTIRPDGSTVEFAGQFFDKELVKATGFKYLAKTFTLPDVQVGSIIEYTYTINFEEGMLFDSHWILSDELFTKKARFSLNPYKGEFGFRWSWHNLPPGAEPKIVAGYIIRMESSNIPPFVTEDYMPPADEMKSRVDFIYDERDKSEDQTKYWKDVGKTWGGLFENFLGKQSAMGKVAQIAAPNDSPEVKLHKLYGRVQQIRNTTYELERTAQEEKRENEKANENVEDVWKRGYGNATELTSLFVALARAAGFEASECRVSGRSRYFFNPATMQRMKLDNAVALVKVNGKDLYLDPGTPFAPFGLLRWDATGVAGLRLDREGGTWIKTPLPPASESRTERVGKLKLSDAGDLEGKLTVTYTGLEAMTLRSEKRHSDDVARKKSLEEDVTSQVGGAAEAELSNKPDWTSSETPLVAEFEVKISGWASSTGTRVLLPAAIFTANEKGMFEHATRVHPIYFAYPHEKTDDITIELPPGWQLASAPAAFDKDGHVVRYSLKVDADGAEKLRLKRSFAIDTMLLDQKYYAPLRSFLQMVRTKDAEQIVLKTGDSHAGN